MSHALEAPRALLVQPHRQHVRQHQHSTTSSSLFVPSSLYDWYGTQLSTDPRATTSITKDRPCLLLYAMALPAWGVHQQTSQFSWRGSFFSLSLCLAEQPVAIWILTNISQVAVQNAACAWLQRLEEETNGAMDQLVVKHKENDVMAAVLTNTIRAAQAMSQVRGHTTTKSQRLFIELC